MPNGVGLIPPLDQLVEGCNGFHNEVHDLIAS